jgi:hypothetical protein
MLKVALALLAVIVGLYVGAVSSGWGPLERVGGVGLGIFLGLLVVLGTWALHEEWQGVREGKVSEEDFLLEFIVGAIMGGACLAAGIPLIPHGFFVGAAIPILLTCIVLAVRGLEFIFGKIAVRLGITY